MKAARCTREQAAAAFRRITEQGPALLQRVRTRLRRSRMHTAFGAWCDLKNLMFALRRDEVAHILRDFGANAVYTDAAAPVLAI